MLHSLLLSFQDLSLVFLAYVIATASPGPSTMAIMALAMSQGRVRALGFAAGVITGSLFWGVLAATGVSAILTTYVYALIALKLAGGAYLIVLALKSLRSAMTPDRDIVAARTRVDAPLGVLYRRGLLFHLTNPKAILSWLAIISIAANHRTPVTTSIALLVGCGVLATVVFAGYALVFSVPAMSGLYRRARRWIEGSMAAIFGYAGLRVLTSRM